MVETDQKTQEPKSQENQQEKPLSTDDTQQEEKQRQTSEQDVDFLQNVSIGEILDFKDNNELNIEGSDMKLQELQEKKKLERQQIEQLQARLMRQTLGLKLQTIDPSKKPQLNQNSTDNKTSDSTEFLYKKLEKKWGLQAIKETADEKEFMENLLTSKEGESDLSQKSILGFSQRKDESIEEFSTPEAMARNNLMKKHSFLNENGKRKNISEYVSRYTHEIDPMMGSSHLDTKSDAQQPKIMRYMNEFREFKPDINIGERWGQIIQESAISRIQYEQQIAKGGNLVSYMARTGKLGVDLFFIVFGMTAAFILPYAIYRLQKEKINYVQKTKNINPQTVPDFYYTEYDLDEISIQKCYYNQYTEEILEEKNKKLKLHKEIQSLTNMLYANK